MKRMLAASLFLMAGPLAGRASACAQPIEGFDRAKAAAIVQASVVGVRGRDRDAIYDVRGTAIVRPAPAGIPIPRRVLILWADFDHGMCGSNGEPLRAGDRIVLYFGRLAGGLQVGGWRKL